MNTAVSPPAEDLEPLLSMEEVAEILGVPMTTMRYWRKRREGPPSFRVGKFVKYRPADVRAFIEELKAAS
jgi:predicted DNA-binding transcriptional regulator AlpA